MSLDADYSKIKNYETVVYQKFLEPPRAKPNPTTEALVFMTMFIGMNSIEEKNHLEFIRRADVWQDINGPILRCGDGTDKRVTLEDVRAHIGLSTNASTMTAQKFKRQMEAAAYDKLVKKRGLAEYCTDSE